MSPSNNHQLTSIKVRDYLSHPRDAAGSGVPIFAPIPVRVSPPDQTENCTDLKLGTHTPLTISKNAFFFFRKSDPDGC